MREFKSNYGPYLHVTDHVHVPRECTDQDKLLFLQWVNKYRAEVEIPWYRETVLKSVLDTEMFRQFFGAFRLKRDVEEWESQVLVFLDKKNKRWLVYEMRNWQSPVYHDDIFGKIV